MHVDWTDSGILDVTRAVPACVGGGMVWRGGGGSGGGIDKKVV